MNRRRFIGLGLTAAGVAAARPQEPAESVVASATRDTTARIGLVGSNFAKGETHDGTPLPGLPDPAPLDAELSAGQIDAMVRRAMEFGKKPLGDLDLIGPKDWVVIKPDISTCFGLEPDPNAGPSAKYLPGSVTDLRLVRSVIGYLIEHGHGRRFTIAEGSPYWKPKEHSKAAVDGWTTDWGGAYDGLSYAGLVESLAASHPGLKFDLVDLNFDEMVEMPVAGSPLAEKNQSGMYSVPSTIQECDWLFSVAPIKVDPRTGVSLTIANYRGIAPGSKYGFPKTGLDKLGDPNAVVTDLFSLRPADYAIAGGSWGVEAAGPQAAGMKSVRHNVIVAGPNAVSVDAVASAVMGFDPVQIKYLRNAESLGLGGWDTDTFWIKGAEIGDVRREFRKPGGWTGAA